MRPPVLVPQFVHVGCPIEIHPLGPATGVLALMVIAQVAGLLSWGLAFPLWFRQSPWAQASSVALTVAVLIGATVGAHALLVALCSSAWMAYLMPVFALGYAGLTASKKNIPFRPATHERKADPMTGPTIQDTIEGKAL